MRDSERSENDQYTLTYNEGTQFLRLFFAFLFDIPSRIVREQTETDTLQRKLRYTLTYSEGTQHTPDFTTKIRDIPSRIVREQGLPLHRAEHLRYTLTYSEGTVFFLS